jgi:hypothetical protein
MTSRAQAGRTGFDRAARGITTARRRAIRTTRRPFLPLAERMEDRTLLATMLWAHAAGGDWDAAANWVNSANPGVVRPSAPPRDQPEISPHDSRARQRASGSPRAAASKSSCPAIDTDSIPSAADRIEYVPTSPTSRAKHH